MIPDQRAVSLFLETEPSPVRFKRGKGKDKGPFFFLSEKRNAMHYFREQNRHKKRTHTPNQSIKPPQ
jgi:hypothetical protein